MASLYQLTSGTSIIRSSDGAYIPDDPANRDYAAYLAWVAAGNTADPYVAPPPPPVTQVSQRQARLALAQAGLLDQVTAAVNAADQTTQITWQYASVIDRSDPLITSVGATLNLTSAQIDALFTAAAAL